jgi:hypothetical protein
MRKTCGRHLRKHSFVVCFGFFINFQNKDSTLPCIPHKIVQGNLPIKWSKRRWFKASHMPLTHKSPHSIIVWRSFNHGRTIWPKIGWCHFSTFQISLFGDPSSVILFTMKHFLEVDNEVILLSNGWIWYY